MSKDSNINANAIPTLIYLRRTVIIPIGFPVRPLYQITYAHSYTLDIFDFIIIMRYIMDIFNAIF